jgi:hypothetical protein
MRFLGADITVRTKQPGVLGCVTVSRVEPIQYTVLVRERLRATSTETLLLLPLLSFQATAGHWLVPLVVDQLFVNLAAQRKQQVGILPGQLPEAGPNHRKQ